MSEVDAKQAERRPPAKRAKVGRWVAVIAGAVLVAWSFACGMLYQMQDRIIFPRYVLPAAAARPTIRGAIEITHETPEGPVYAWFCPAPDASAQNPAPAVIFFHGNAELIDQQNEVASRYRALGVSVLLPEYRGYGRAAGNPSQAGIGDDSEAFYAWLIEQPEVDASRIIYHGRSLGGGVACELASRQPPTAMVLESTFSSIVAIAHSMLVPGFLVKHPFRNDRVVAEATWPMLIVHGESDEILPVKHGRRLRDLAPEGLLTYREYPGGHNDFPARGYGAEYWRDIEALLVEAGALKEARTQ